MYNGQDLLQAGYRYYTHGKSEYAEGMWQKRILAEDKSTTLYFITVDVFKFHNMTSYMPEALLYFSEDKCMNVTYYNADSVTEVEEFFKLAYERMGCVPDPHN